MTYQCREKGEGDDDWVTITVSSPSRADAAKRYAKDCELGPDERQEMKVEVRLDDSPDSRITTFLVRVDWSPTYHATEIL